jgi:hypothetical protein
LLIHGTSARAAWIAACAACANGAAGLTLLSAYGEAGELLGEPLAFTFWTCGLLVSQNNRFKAVLALLANVFENRHIDGSARIMTPLL